jgi:hypothetical protein
MQGEDRRAVQSAATVWIFHGTTARFAAGVFFSEADGLAWAALHELTGILSEYPVGNGCYDLAIAERRFRPTKPHHGTPEHVAGFSPGLNHVHLVDGAPD